MLNVRYQASKYFTETMCVFGWGRRGPTVAAISVVEVQNMVDSLSSAGSVFLPDKWLIDRGSEINICYNYELYSCIGPADIENCKSLGSTPLPVLGKVL